MDYIFSDHSDTLPSHPAEPPLNSGSMPNIKC